MSRVALQVGGAWLRVATDDGLFATVRAGDADVATVLAGLLDGPVDELLVVHPASAAPPAYLGSGAAAAALPAARVRAVPAPIAALAGLTACGDRAVARAVPGHDVRPDDVSRDGVPGDDAAGAAAFGAAASGAPVPPGAPGGRAPGDAAVPAGGGGRTGVGDAVVVDVGLRGADVTRVTGDVVVAVRAVAVGGERLDAAAAGLLAGAGAVVRPAQVRQVRETLALLPEIRAGSPPVAVAAATLDAALTEPLAVLVEVVRAVVAAGPGPPPPVLLIGGVARAPLLAELLDAAGVPGVRVAERPDSAAVLGALRLPPAPAGTPTGPAPAPLPAWLPPVVPRRHRRSRVALGVLAAAAALLGLLAAGTAPPEVAPRPAAGELVQYGYAVDLPTGWAHTGGLPERRRSLLTPVAAPDGSDLISVERSPLGYDAGAEPERARAELRATFAAAVAGGAPLSRFDDGASFAGRPVVVYREAGGASAADVDWYVVLDGDAQLSVGCRHTRAGRAGVDAACATVVGSLHRTP